MAKLYFKYGAMGSSKTANALITKFNYEERGMKVWLLKPATDNRDGRDVIKSRIGLEERCVVVTPQMNLIKEFERTGNIDVIIVDEAQFLEPEQVDQLRDIVDEKKIPTLCFGLRTDFRTKVFPGSLRLLEIADSISEIKTICRCGSKATVNARIDDKGNVITDGEQVFIGGNDSYEAMCFACYKKKIIKKER